MSMKELLPFLMTLNALKITHTGRGQNKVGPQNLVRAHKMLRPRAQMALENVGSFLYLMYKRYKKIRKRNLALKKKKKKKMRALYLLIPGA